MNRFFKNILSATIFLVFTCCSTTKINKSESINFVDPMIGTGFHGHTFPGPSTPHGQIQLSPDTHIIGWHASSGYHYEDTTLYGFSHNHLSGTGIGDLGDVLLLPFTGIPAISKPVGTLYHDKEFSEVGYYSIDIEPWGIFAELTSSERVGFHRYTYPLNENAKLMIDLSHILQPNWGHTLLESEIHFIDDYTIKGYRKTKGWAKNDPIWFLISFDKPIKSKKILVDEELSTSLVVKGKNIISYCDFGNLISPLNIKVSISNTREDGPEINMSSVSPEKSFDDIRKESREIWSDEFSSIEISTSDTSVLKNFYSALYHTKLAPTLFSDFDGSFRGMDQKIYKNDKIRYSVYSLWDTFRSWYPLMTIIDPQRAKKWTYDLLDMAKEGGVLPKWPLHGNYTGTMIGYPAVSIFSDAISKKIISADKEDFLNYSLKSSTWQEEFYEKHKGDRAQNVMPKHIYYKEKIGYVPVDLEKESVSYGLEMAYYDWCIANIAQSIGREEVYNEYLKKSKYYSFYFDKEKKFMRGRKLDGTWEENFDPFFSDHLRSSFVEGNSWQWTPTVLHDIEGLRDLIGGEKEFGEWLDNLFTMSSKITGENASQDITGLIGQYAHGNEPSHHVPYLYQYSDRPWRTQEVLHQVLYEFYKPSPDGLIGNEDCGQMSAWYILNAIGLYQITPGKPIFTVGRPIVDQARIKLKEGYFDINIENNSKKNLYISSVYLNGIKLEKFEIDFSQILPGNSLRIVMSDKPYSN